MVYDRSNMPRTSMLIDSTKTLNLIGRYLLLTTVTFHTEDVTAHMVPEIAHKAPATTHMEYVESLIDTVIALTEVLAAYIVHATIDIEVTTART